MLVAGLYEIIPLESVRGVSEGQGAVGVHVQHKNSQRKVLLWPDTHNYAVQIIITPCVRSCAMQG